MALKPLPLLNLDKFLWCIPCARLDAWPIQAWHARFCWPCLGALGQWPWLMGSGPLTSPPRWL